MMGCADIIAAFNERFNAHAGEAELVICDVYDYGKTVEVEVRAPIYRSRHFIRAPMDRGIDAAILECAKAAREWADSEMETARARLASQ